LSWVTKRRLEMKFQWVPIIVLKMRLIGEGYNAPDFSLRPRRRMRNFKRFRRLSKMKTIDLPGETLYVTLRPCSMLQGNDFMPELDRVLFMQRWNLKWCC